MPVLSTQAPQPAASPDAETYQREVLKLAIRSLLTVHCAHFQPTTQPRPLPARAQVH
jgi:hypothetical protein